MTQLKTRIRALRYSLFLISMVVVVESVVGITTGSLALLGDAAHASFDTLATVMLLAAAVFASKPPDIDHTYGHEKLESLGSLLGGLLLSAFSIFLIYEASLRIWNNAVINPGVIGLGATLFTLSIDVTRIYILRNTSTSPAVEADLLHALSDCGSTIIALIGVWLADVKIYYGDPIASVALGIMLVYLSFGLIKNAVVDLSDKVAPTYVEAVKEAIVSSDGVREVHKLRVRRVGPKTFVDASIAVKGGQTVDQAHLIVSKIETNLEQRFGNVSVVIHVEPSKKDTSISDLARNLPLYVEGVKEAHNVVITNVDAGSLLSVDVLVDPKINLTEAHKIADEVENLLRREMPSLIEVLVHIEPYRSGVVTGKLIEKAEIARALNNAMRKWRAIHSVDVSSIVDVHDRLIVSVKCKLDRKLPVDRVHSIVEHVKEEVGAAIPQASVEVHAEPDEENKD